MADAPKPVPPLTATYRVQLHKDFPLASAAEQAAYLARLGVSHLYASPILTARPGSTHGYDVADPSRVNPELGGEEARARLVAALRGHGLGLLLDVVPNHMGIGPANPYWEDVLAHGRASEWAHLFDVDWDSPARALRGKVLLPVLGDELEAVLGRGELTVKREGGRPPRLAYFDSTFPLAPESLETLGDDHEPTAADVRALLGRQHYVLTFWRKGAREINYRRFFDINELAALRAEDERVFAFTHERPLAWIAAGELDGLRIDHVDGLADPLAYLHRLREAAESRRAGPRGEAAFPIVVEKILSPGEQLRPEWPVQGTTGYEFLNDLEAVFIDPAGAARVEAGYRRLLRLRGETPGFHEVAMRGKVRILRGALRPDVERLTRLLVPIARRDPRGTGLTRRELIEAVTQLLAAMPAYRTYVDGRAAPAAEDVALVERALARAIDRGTAPAPALRLVADVLLLRDEGTQGVAEERERLAFVQRFQQTSGPATAKGVEDTALYLYFPLASRNEVGGEPDRDLTDAVGTFHRGARERADRWPRGLLCTNTHDTKRSADVRARLDVLSEIPEEWLRAVERWRRLTRALRRTVDTRTERRTHPDPNSEYLFFQSLVGIWPLGARDVPDAATLGGLAERLHAYMLKAAREGKTMTSWTDADPKFEGALERYVRGVLDAGQCGTLLTDVARFVERIARPGLWNALSRIVLHLATPGTPDIYQGDELWNFALVDPDNRRPVDYAARARALARVEAATTVDARSALLRELVAAPEEGTLKLLLTRALLHARRDHPRLVREGSHHPLAAAGERGGHVVAFGREAGDAALVAVGTRLTAGLAQDGRAPLGEPAWGTTTLPLPATLAGRAWRCLLTGRRLRAADGAFRLAELLADAPVAALLAEGGER